MSKPIKPYTVKRRITIVHDRLYLIIVRRDGIQIDSQKVYADNENDALAQYEGIYVPQTDTISVDDITVTQAITGVYLPKDKIGWHDDETRTNESSSD